MANAAGPCLNKLDPQKVSSGKVYLSKICSFRSCPLNSLTTQIYQPKFRCCLRVLFIQNDNFTGHLTKLTLSKLPCFPKRQRTQIQSLTGEAEGIYIFVQSQKRKSQKTVMFSICRRVQLFCDTTDCRKTIYIIYIYIFINSLKIHDPFMTKGSLMGKKIRKTRLRITRDQPKMAKLLA